MNSINPSVFKDGFHIAIFGIELDILPYIFFGTFISLGWFGIMPILGTMMYLRGDFDSPTHRYMFTWGLYRFVFLITDDPRVISKERGGN
jgi:hypothetical protein